MTYYSEIEDHLGDTRCARFVEMFLDEVYLLFRVGKMCSITSGDRI